MELTLSFPAVMFMPECLVRFTIALSASSGRFAEVTARSVPEWGIRPAGDKCLRALVYLRTRSFSEKTRGKKKTAIFRGRSPEGIGVSGALYFQLLDSGPESAGINSEDGGGAVFALDLPAGLFEDFEDVIPFDFLFEADDFSCTFTTRLSVLTVLGACAPLLDWDIGGPSI
jgi:hypothetical protein